MKILKPLARIALGVAVLGVAAIETIWPHENTQAASVVVKPAPVLRIVVITIIAVALLAAIGGLLFVGSGIYPIAADKPHFAPVRLLLEIGRTRSIELHSRGIQAPNLLDRNLVKNGFFLYRKNCQPCHGAPGVAPEQIGLGINPKPPQLVTAGAKWSDPELYWITSHGLKMSGMPAFSPRLSDADRWGIVAFLRRLSRLSPAEYQSLLTAADQGQAPMDWGSDDDEGFAKLRTGHPGRGRRLLVQYGCTTCHTVPGLSAGQVGPPLTSFAERQYIAGSIVNLPSNAMNWIVNPKNSKSQTAMPVVGVSPADATDIAAYLYTLGSPKRMDTIQRTSGHGGERTAVRRRP